MLKADADRASDSRCLEVHTQKAQDAVFGCSNSMNSMGSCDYEIDPLAQCLAEIEDSEHESAESLKALSAPKVPMTA